MRPLPLFALLALMAMTTSSWTQSIDDQEAIYSTLSPDDEFAERLQRAIDADNLLPPSSGNAMALAIARSMQFPNDLRSWRIVSLIVATEKSRAVVSLNKGQPIEAWSLMNRLHDALTNALDEGQSDRLVAVLSDVGRWRLDIEPSHIESLTTAANRAIDQRLIGSAPQGKRSASDYIDILATILGQKHAAVLELGERGASAYRQLIDQAVTKELYLEALGFVDRMEVFAEKFASGSNDSMALRKSIEAKQAKLEHYQELLQLVAHHREQGRLMRPKGENALGLVIKAIALDIRSLQTKAILRNVIWSIHDQIDDLMEAGRLDEAIVQLDHLSDVLNDARGSDVSLLSEHFSNEANDLRQRKWEKHQRLAAEIKRLQNLEQKRASDEKANPPRR